jgi:hypothetical protein
MNTHFCKVGKIKAKTDNITSIKELKKRVAKFVEDMSKVEFVKDINQVA